MATKTAFEAFEKEKETLAQESQERQARAKRLSNLRTARTPWESAWMDVSAYLSPFTLNLVGDKQTTAGDARLRINNDLYSGAAVRAVDIFANGFVGNLCPRGTPWFSLRVHDKQFASGAAVRPWVSDVETHIADRYDQSNFYEAIFIMAKQAAAYGTSAMYIKPDIATKDIIFNVLEIGSYWIDEDENGTVDTLYRQFWMQGRNIIREFRDEVEKDANILKTLEEGQFEFFKIIHSVQPREDYDKDDESNKNFPFESVYTLEGQDNFELRCSGFKSFPFAVWRFRKEPGYTYGIGPGIDALRDGEIMQQVAKTMLKADHMATEPPILLPMEMRNNEDELQLFPGGRNYYDGPNPDAVRPINMTQTVIGHQREEMLRRSLNDHFFVDFMMMLQGATRQMTAQEVIEKQAEKAAVLSTIIGRFNSELMDIVFQRIVEIDYDLGLLPDLPEGLPLDKLNLDYVGPLAMVQKYYHRNAGTQRFLGQILPLSQAYPQMLDRIDPDSLVDDAADANNVSPKIIVPKDKADKKRQAVAQAQQAAIQNSAQQQAMQQAAEFAQKAGKAPEPGSLANIMVNGGR